ncbi:hypothetical protein AAAT30_005805, partial [Segatella sinensis]|uniref:hypothetical protein n=1 Tax=Segatella sinensis TaxID=3085167 RepID=UPI00399B21E2
AGLSGAKQHLCQYSRLPFFGAKISIYLHMAKSRFTSLNADFCLTGNAKTHLLADNLLKGDNRQRRHVGGIIGKELVK